MCYSVLVEQAIKGVRARTDLAFERDDRRFKELEERKLADPKHFKTVADGRIYPNYWTGLIVSKNGKRLLTPMRYRVKPSWSPKELPVKYNTFNARLDALELRQTWKPLFGRNHALLPFYSFFEWVKHPDTKKSTVIQFSPGDDRQMLAPCLYDIWGEGEEQIISFAIITTDPPQEVAFMGHDRCPVVLREEYADRWLNPQGQSKVELRAILEQQADMVFKYKWAA